ncbi:MAG TPA: potassium-transporting ATPase subunit KdpC [Nevskiaceae bacterium]|nr:potassium-transporting ATPase subunit KdpC [Nevskiaceae bacterium]
MTTHFRPALVLLVLFTLLLGFAYPMAISGLGALLFPRQAAGSLIERDGRVIGSALVGQVFTGEKYFHPRPSAISGTDPNDSTKTVGTPYDASNSMGSNAGPTAKSLIDRVTADSAALKAENPSAPVPVDLATASSSGLDPHISLAAALFQLPRVARARQLDQAKLKALVDAHLQGRWLGIFGEPVVNVLELNLALDQGG